MTDFILDPPQRVLMGPGPSHVPARVLAALARPTVGYLDASYVALMEALMPQLRWLFGTTNEATFAVTGAGTAAMECAIVNVTERGDRAVCCVHGYFGDRMRQITERVGADVTTVSAPWGTPTNAAAVDAALKAAGGASVVTVVHGETSTGVQQSIPELAEVAHRHGALLVVDAVASLGGVVFDTDGWEADVVYTGSQKCISAPPGISPITFGPRAMARIETRRTPCASWYLDAQLNLTYWRKPHAYHHTGPINLTYALHEALAMMEEEGHKARFARTDTVARALWAGLEGMGVELVVAPEDRLPTLTTVRVPAGVDGARVRMRLMDEQSIEIAGGLGDLQGIAWRIGLMGASCSRQNLTLLLEALENILADEGHAFSPGAGLAAAARVLES